MSCASPQLAGASWLVMLVMLAVASAAVQGRSVCSCSGSMARDVLVQVHVESLECYACV